MQVQVRMWLCITVDVTLYVKFTSLIINVNDNSFVYDCNYKRSFSQLSFNFNNYDNKNEIW